MDIFRDYNIISNKYWEGNDPKQEADTDAVKKELDERYKKTHDFNHLTCKFYDEMKQEDYIKEREKRQKEHGKDYLNRLPPTLKARETIVFDSTKEVPEEVKAFDLKKKNQKRRYEKRYDLEQEYRDLDIENQDKTENMAINRYKGQKYYEEKQKGYDNITLDPTREQINRLDGFAHTKPNLSLWDQIQQQAEERAPDRAGNTLTEIPEFPVTRVVEIDTIPMYRRSAEAPKDSLAQQAVQSDERKVDQQESQIDQYPSYVPQQSPAAVYESQPVFESMQQKSVSGDRQRLYNPELDKHANLYRQPEADQQSNQKPASVANSGNNRYSRMNSGMSNKSRLSFASEGMRSRLSNSSNKLPAIRQPESANPYNPQPSVRSGSKRSIASSVKKSNLIESGAFY